jgi:UDP-hydrolysing UDP-N-acetyl-D-glucosamine 2-epimerase
MAKSTGLGTIEAAMVFNNLKPDFVVIVGDRFEMMAVTLSAAFMNIRIAHTMGGEVTGTIDESIRHAITKFSHVHFTANEDARQRVVRMGEDPDFVFNVGCPRTDLVAEEMKKDSGEILKVLFERYGGVGEVLDLGLPFLLVSQHPVTTEYGDSRRQIEQTLAALEELKMPTVMLWPNIDAGSDDVSKGIRTFREKKRPDWLHVFKNLPTSVYLHLMKRTACLVGNSSSGIREGTYIGTPVVNVGTRQNRRLRGGNVRDVPYEKNSILEGIRYQIGKGRYKSESIYGDGKAGKRIAEILVTADPAVQKTICY